MDETISGVVGGLFGGLVLAVPTFAAAAAVREFRPLRRPALAAAVGLLLGVVLLLALALAGRQAPPTFKPRDVVGLPLAVGEAWWLAFAFYRWRDRRGPRP